jgi:predicted acylesterase/phospholipase RssA/CRP-like cAMP-binding protein
VEPDAIDQDAIDRLIEQSAVFGRLDADARALLSKEFESRLARRGEVIMREGDAPDGMYVVASGRLQVVLTRDDGNESVVNEIGRGDLVGEMALLTDRPRSATITALRDSHLLFLSTDAYGRVVHAHPEALRVMSSALIDKLMDTIRRGPRTTPATSIAIVPLDAGRDVAELGARLAAALEPLVGPVPVVGRADVAGALGPTPSELDLAIWREQLEASHRAVVYAGDHDPGAAPDWTAQCAQQADLILLAATASSERGLRPVEHVLRTQGGVTSRRVELVLLHTPSTVTPRGTRHWLAPRAVERHHHVRVDRDSDYARVARLLVGRGIGLVLSGGGARGIAHIGVLRALRKRNVPIDATAGASIGAIVAGAVARGDDPDEVARQIRAAVVERSPVDLTLPTVAFASGNRVTQHIKDGAQGLDLEDAWLNFLCVSTNLTRGSLEIHRHGSGWAAVRSSFSVPGLYPPMSNERGDVLVDGGLLDNMPVAPMRETHAGITVIAVDVGARRDVVAAHVPPTGAVSGWRFLAASLRARTLDNLTSLPRILMRLTELGSLGDDDRGECYIRPDIEGVGLLDFDRFDQLVEAGERDAAVVLDEWLATRPLRVT